MKLINNKMTLESGDIEIVRKEMDKVTADYPMDIDDRGNATVYFDDMVQAEIAPNVYVDVFGYEKQGYSYEEETNYICQDWSEREISKVIAYYHGEECEIADYDNIIKQLAA